MLSKYLNILKYQWEIQNNLKLFLFVSSQIFFKKALVSQENSVEFKVPKTRKKAIYNADIGSSKL